MQVIVDDFNNSVGREKHLYVEMMSMSDIDQKTLVATAGGVPPDVAGLWDPMVVQLGSLGALEPLEDLAKAHGITEGYYKPVFWNGCHFNGHLYALVSTPAAVALFYNKRIFQENAAKLRAAGLDPDQSTADRSTNWIDTPMCSPNSSPTPRASRHVRRAGYMPMPPDYDWYVTSIPLWFGNDEWDSARPSIHPDRSRRLAGVPMAPKLSPQARQGRRQRIFHQPGQFQFPAEFIHRRDPRHGDAGTVDGHYIHHLRPEMDHDWAAAPFPSAVPGLDRCHLLPLRHADDPAGCQHIPEAFEFIAYVNRQDVMEKLCMLHCKNSPLAKCERIFPACTIRIRISGYSKNSPPAPTHT